MGYLEILATATVREVNAYLFTGEDRAEPVATRAKAICLGRYWRGFEDFEHYPWHDTNAHCENCTACVACNETTDPHEEQQEWCRAGDHNWLMGSPLFHMNDEERFTAWFWSDEREAELESAIVQSNNALALPERSDFERQLVPLVQAVEQLRFAPLHR